MRILYFSPRQNWPLTTGARLRDFHLATQLAQGAAVTCFALRQPQEVETPIPPSQDAFERVVCAVREKSYSPGKLLRGVLGPDPVTVLNFWSRDVAARLAELLRSSRFDSVQIESVHLLRYVQLIRACAPATAIVADWHNIESELMARYAATAPSLAHKVFGRRTAQLIAQAEGRLLKSCDANTVASDREREKLQERAPGARLHTIPNGVDVAFYRHGSSAEADDATRNEILFVGSMDYHANVDAAEWFVHQVWPTLAARSPGMRFSIVGRDPAPRVKALEQDRITVTGTVDDVRPYYARARAVVAPLRVGSGTRLKILEAMAAGVPVVSTRMGAEGLDVASGENLLLADSADDMADALVRLEAEASLRRRLVESARDLVERRYDWKSIGVRLLKVHQDAAASKRTGVDPES